MNYWASYVSIVMSIAGGWTMLCYRYYAAGAAYPIGSWYLKDWPIIVGGLTVFGAVYAAFTQHGWLSAIVMTVIGVIASFLLLYRVKSWSQMLAPALAICGYIFLWFV